jgi:hypothetical protein
MTNQLPDATKMVLSPAAQAVLDAAFPAYDDEALYVATSEQHAGMIAAAALRAAANYVGEWESAEELRAIANELDGGTTTPAES